MATARELRQRVRKALRWNDVPPFVRRVIVGVIGSTILLIGIVLLILPGPAFLVIPIGLAILATEFVWARHWLEKAKTLMQRMKKSGKSGKTE